MEVYDEDLKADVVYVVEDIKLLKNLMRNNEKILRNIFSVMAKGGSTLVIYYNFFYYLIQTL